MTTPRDDGRGTAGAGLRVGLSYGDRLVWMTDDGLVAALDDAVAVGARWVRADLAWREVQEEGPGDFRWQPFDRVVDAAGMRGLAVLPVLAYTPAWARAPGCRSDKCPPADPAAFAAFAAAAARRYGPQGVHAWEVWNEPNLAGFWAPAPDPAGYTALLRAVAPALRKADSSARVIFGGLAATRTSPGRMAQTDFLAAVAERGGHRLVDAIGYHPYTYPHLASAITSFGTAWEHIDRVEPSLYGVLKQHGRPELPLWITEYGAPTNGPGSASDGRPQTIGPNTTHVTEAWQASIAADSVRAAAVNPRIAALVWYCEQDLADDRSSSENYFGLRRQNGTAKPAHGAFRQAVSALRR